MRQGLTDVDFSCTIDIAQTEHLLRVHRRFFGIHRVFSHDRNGEYKSSQKNKILFRPCRFGAVSLVVARYSQFFALKIPVKIWGLKIVLIENSTYV
jgi:hypothetical protein